MIRIQKFSCQLQRGQWLRAFHASSRLASPKYRPSKKHVGEKRAEKSQVDTKHVEKQLTELIGSLEELQEKAAQENERIENEVVNRETRKILTRREIMGVKGPLTGREQEELRVVEAAIRYSNAQLKNAIERSRNGAGTHGVSALFRSLVLDVPRLISSTARLRKEIPRRYDYSQKRPFEEKFQAAIMVAKTRVRRRQFVTRLLAICALAFTWQWWTAKGVVPKESFTTQHKQDLSTHDANLAFVEGEETAEVQQQPQTRTRRH